MNQHLNRSVAVAVLLLAQSVLGLARLEAEETPKPDATKAEIVSISTVGPSVEKQSDADIARYNNHFYIAFVKPLQERQHVIHILQSADGRDWKSVATLRSKAEDRSPDLTFSTHYSGRPVWFSTMPSGRLCVTARSTKTILWSTADGKSWREEVDFDLSRSYSRIFWQNKRAYCVSDESKSCGEQFELFRVETADKGLPPKTAYKLAHNSHRTRTGPRESQLAFAKDRAFCLLSFKTYNYDEVRRWLIPSTSYATGQFGVSKAPYKQWKWTPTNLRFGHPNLLVLKDHRIIATVFIDVDGGWNALCEVDAETGKLTELLRLPTGGTAQPVGVTEHAGHIWVCFYDGPQNEKKPPTLKVAKIQLGK